MSFNYLPLGFHVIVVILLGVYMIVSIIKARREYPKLLCTGLLIISVGGMLAVIGKWISKTSTSINYIDPIGVLIISCIGCILFVVGIYTKVKNDAVKKKEFMTVTYVIITVLAACGLAVLFADYLA